MWGKQNFARYPWRTQQGPWVSLTTEILLQRTRADQVVPVFEKFRRRYPAPEALAREQPDRLLKTIGSLGLRWRAPLMIQMAGIVADRGRVPDQYDELVTLPGVGPYAASAYLSLHRSVRAAIVDSNVVRWIGRLLGVPTDEETRRKRWLIEAVDALTPSRSFRNYNYAVLDFAMKVCRPRPRCDVCPFARDTCVFAAQRAGRSERTLVSSASIGARDRPPARRTR